MLDSLKLTPRRGQYGCGIYEAGDTDKCYLEMFVTDSGRAIPITGRILNADDLMQAYEWGRLDALGKNTPFDDEPEEISMEDVLGQASKPGTCPCGEDLCDGK